jgi:hypothetical protein
VRLDPISSPLGGAVGRGRGVLGTLVLRSGTFKGGQLYIYIYELSGSGYGGIILGISQNILGGIFVD